MRRMAWMVFGFCLFAAAPAAADGFQPATPERLVRVAMHYGLFDMADDKQIDEYIQISACDIARQFYRNDFEWQRIRRKMRDWLAGAVAAAPSQVSVLGPVNLARYDFDKGGFVLDDDAPLRSINTFLLSERNGTNCLGERNIFIPGTFRAILPVPLDLDLIPVGEADGAALLARMKEAGNASRTVYARVKLVLTGVRADRSTLGDRGVVSFDAALDSIEFYEDKEQTRRVFTYTP